jgi:hypothetical protein
MCGLFREKYPDTTVHYPFYLKYFDDTFTLRFGRPQVDISSVGEELNAKLKNQSLADSVKETGSAQIPVHRTTKS